MTDEVIKYLAPRQNENFIDATTGLGGHSKLILEKNGPKGQLLAIDQDKIALEEAAKNLKKFEDRVTYINKNFDELGLIVRNWPVEKIDGILMDLGVSTYQLTSSERGFSFSADEADSDLDMRMSPDRTRISAADIVNKWSEPDLKRILKNFGEEPFAGKIAKNIVRSREKHQISKTGELVLIIKKSLSPAYRASREKHFATSTFRALRMAVNHELEALENGLKQAVQVLSPGGRIVIISFHSLEDRIVKNFFRDNETLEILNRKPIVATEEEIINNSKARSAKLRAAKKIS